MDGAVTQAGFLGAVEALARRLPEAPCAINLCEDRGHFMLAFAALCARGQTNLLPPSRAAGAVQAIARAYPGCYLLCDGEFDDLGVPAGVSQKDQMSPALAPSAAQFRVRPADLDAVPASAPPAQIAAAAIAAIAFTSGSTGGPQPHPKSWRNLVLTAQLCVERFLGPGGTAHIITTVPPQHMYGLELSVMLALAGGCATHAARPLFPGDVQAALQSVPEPRVLVTTPVHLKSLAASGLAKNSAFPALRKVISATAPLSRELAQQAEQKLGAPVHEIYGCTEAGSMCTRRTIEGERWRPYPGLQMRHGEGITHVSGPHLDAPAVTPDVVETHADGSITLLGRAADMVKVAGKRASLAELTGRLLRLPGVEDGVMFMPSDHDNARLAALVVAPGLSETGLLDALTQQIDPAFLPRPLRIVGRLPRNELGKLPRAELLALLEPRRA
jgi:acyl-coenzyme A synthetase/AMP-(fatty) acid ligase